MVISWRFLNRKNANTAISMTLSFMKSNETLKNADIEVSYDALIYLYYCTIGSKLSRFVILMTSHLKSLWKMFKPTLLLALTMVALFMLKTCSPSAPSWAKSASFCLYSSWSNSFFWSSCLMIPTRGLVSTTTSKVYPRFCYSSGKPACKS